MEVIFLYIAYFVFFAWAVGFIISLLSALWNLTSFQSEKKTVQPRTSTFKYNHTTSESKKYYHNLSESLRRIYSGKPSFHSFRKFIHD
jgi:cytoskeletal protein RodZ